MTEIISGIPHTVNRDLILEVQRGNVPGMSILVVFSENPNIQSGTGADIWDFPAVTSYTFSSTDAIDSMSSDNASDTGNILIDGLDTNFNEVKQIVPLDGQNRVPLTTPLLRHNLSQNISATDLLGNVYIYENTAIVGGVPSDSSKVRGYIAILEGISLQGTLTVPAGKSGFFIGLNSSITKQPAAGDAVFTGKARIFGGVFVTRIRYDMSSTGTSHVNRPPFAMERFPEKTDFFGSSAVSANGTGISVTFRLLLIDN